MATCKLAVEPVQIVVGATADNTAAVDAEFTVTTAVPLVSPFFIVYNFASLHITLILNSPSTKPEIFKDLIRTNAYSMIGDSGGPLCQVNDFKVIGVCRAIRKHKDQLMNHQSYFTDIKMLKKWNDELDNALEPIYTEKRSLPVIPFVKIELQNYKYKLPD
jgi:hypothetical protein